MSRLPIGYVSLGLMTRHELGLGRNVLISPGVQGFRHAVDEGQPGGGEAPA
jgi:hypothetical protein